MQLIRSVPTSLSPLQQAFERARNWKRRILRQGETANDRLQRVRVASKDLVLFTRQFVTLFRGGVPLDQCLETLSQQETNVGFGLVILEVKSKVIAGSRFSDSVAKFPRVFPKIFEVMVRIGEETGCLESTMDSLASWLERDSELKTRVRSAMTYPAFIISTTIVLTLGLFYGVMPAFLTIFTEMHVQLPLITRIVLGFTRAIREPLFWLLTLAFLGVVRNQLRKAWADRKKRLILYGSVLRVPILGGILWNGSTARFCAASEILLNSGSNLLNTLRLAGAVCGSPVIEHNVTQMIETVKDGQSISVYMRKNPKVFSRTLANFVAAGEESSRLPEMFEFASSTHQMDMDTQVDALKAALEPLMLATVAILVGTIILSIFLPLYGFLTQM